MMPNESTKIEIVALVPIRNEAYLLEEFLQLTLKFADHVIIADQCSTDGTRGIAQQFDAVTVVENPSSRYDEAVRSNLLISTARKLFGNQSILFAIDADELFYPSKAALEELKSLKNLKPGTTLMVDKPSFIASTARWIEYGPIFPLGYVDDGTEYQGSMFHTRRVPMHPDGVVYHCHSVKFVHLDAMDLDAMLSKRRLYSMLERDAENSRLTTRWKQNSPVFLRSLQAESTSVDPNVIECFRRNGVDVSDLRRERPLWWDLEALHRFNKSGFKRYQWDDIWWHDWERTLEEAFSMGVKNLPEKIRRPSLCINLVRNVWLTGYWLLFSIWRKLKRCLK